MIKDIGETVRVINPITRELTVMRNLAIRLHVKPIMIILSDGIIDVTRSHGV